MELQPTDEHLMRRVQKGDFAAFEKLYERFHRKLFSYIARFVGDRMLAEDILQETFLRVYKDRDRFKKDSKFSIYLFTICRNLCIDALKKWEKKHVLLKEQNAWNRAPDTRKGPLEKMEEADRAKILQREINALPRDQREVLFLNRYSGLTYKEIAKLLDITPSAAKQKAYRSLSALKKKLQERSE